MWWLLSFRRRHLWRHGYIPHSLWSCGVRGLFKWAGVGNSCCFKATNGTWLKISLFSSSRYLNYLHILEILFDRNLVCLKYSGLFLPFERILCSCNNNLNTLIIMHSPAAVYHNNRITMHLLTHFLKPRPKNLHFSMPSERRSVLFF